MFARVIPQFQNANWNRLFLNIQLERLGEMKRNQTKETKFKPEKINKSEKPKEIMQTMFLTFSNTKNQSAKEMMWKIFSSPEICTGGKRSHSTENSADDRTTQNIMYGGGPKDSWSELVADHTTQLARTNRLPGNTRNKRGKIMLQINRNWLQ